MSDLNKLDIVNVNDLPDDLLNLPDSMFEALDKTGLGDEVFKTKPTGYFEDSFRRLMKNKLSFTSLIVIVILILLAIFAPMFNEFTHLQQHVEDPMLVNMPPRIPGLERLGIAAGRRWLNNRQYQNLTNPDHPMFIHPDLIYNIREAGYIAGIRMVDVLVDFYAFMGAEDMYFWFGSDYLGRDLFTRLFRGSRVSFAISFTAVFLNLIIGIILGGIMGYYGGTLDLIMMRIMEILDGIPNLVVIILFMLFIGAGIEALIVALILTGWIGVARMVRAQFYRFKIREYVLAARTIGVKDAALIFRHIFPNTVGPLITRTMFAIPGAIFAEAFLAFIGLGIQPPDTSMGVLLSDAQRVLLQFPYKTFFPAVLISLIMVSFNLLANGLRDAFDPTKRGEA